MKANDVKNRLIASFAKDCLLYPPCPEGLTPYPFQRAGVEYMLTSPIFSYLLGDPMGLGKTIQAIMYANHLRIKNILVVCPASLLEKWKSEIEKWHIKRDIKVQVVRDTINKTLDVHIVSYDMVEKWHSHLPKKTLLIIDECHMLKNSRAQRTKLIYKQSELTKIRHKIAISGTAALNRPMELYETIKALSWHAIGGMDMRSYGFKYCGGFRDSQGVYDFNGASNLDELGQRLRAYLMVRREKHAVLTDLPSKTTEIFRLSEAGDVEAFEMELKKIKKAKLDLGLDHIATVRRQQGEFKVPLAIPIIENFMEEEKKLVIFAHHKNVIAELQKRLSKFKIVTLDGSTPVHLRPKILDDFQKGDAEIFIGSISAAGVGIELTAAKIAIFVESAWTPAENDQASDRLHRIGQKENVRIIFLTLKHDLDEYMLKRTLEKAKNLNAIMDLKTEAEDLND